MKNVLVMDANQRSALAITRSLGKRGIYVVTADTSFPTLAGSSKYSAYSEVLPKHNDEISFIHSLQEIITKHQIDLLIPVTEISLYTVVKHRDIFDSMTTIPVGSQDSINSLSDKAALVETCLKLDLPVPRSIGCTPGGSEALESKEFDYPVVLKPYKSRIHHAGKWLSTSVQYAQNETELLKLCKENVAFREHKFLLQEYIEGDGAGIFLLYNKGKCTAQFSHRRLKEKPPSGGVSVLSESVPMNEDMLSISKKLLDHANWHGVAMVEFKVTPEGRPYVMEVNTRFWGSLQLAVDAGVDFPYLLYLISQSPEHIEAKTGYKIGVRLRWLLGDFDRLYLIFKSGTYSKRQKLGEFFSFCKLFTPNLRYEVNRVSDLKPFLYELKNYIKDIFRSRA